MSDWVTVVAATALAVGEHIVVDVAGCEVAVFNLNGEFFAIEDVCTHDGGELASGELIGDEIVCPRHGARFCVKTGEVKCAPAYENIYAFPIRVLDGMIEVCDDRY